MSEPNQKQGVTPRELKYRAMLETRFGMLRPEDQPLVEIDRAIPLERLIVVPELSSHLIPVSSKEQDWKTEKLLDVLLKDRITVVLGDPGSGKSMLVRWLISRLASSAPNAYTKAMGRLIPIPVILREMDLRELGSERIGRWETFLRAIVAQSFMKEVVLLSHLEAWLESGALLVIDGFDEVASVDLRRRIADALLEFQFFKVYASSKCLLTSRIVGYDREPIVTLQTRVQVANELELIRLEADKFAQLILQKNLFPSERTIPMSDETSVIVQVDRTPCFFMAPLSDAKIRDFVLGWIQVRESDPSTVKEWAGNFASQLISRPVLRELARNPQTLGLACYVQRIDGSLPEGRAKLFERVISAFLNRIPELRRQPFPFPREDARRWLSRIAFEMQKRRSDVPESQRKDGRGVAVSSQEAGVWVRAEGLRLHGSSPEVEGFLKAVGEASGIFLEREPDRFEFLHLSFQEYLAALHIAESAVWIERSRLWSSVAESAQTHSNEDLQSFLGQGAWLEVFRLLFQSLPEDRAVELLGRLFKQLQPGLDPSNVPRINSASGKVLSQVVADKFAPIPEAVRREAASILFDWEWRYQHEGTDIPKAEGLTEFHLLFPFCDTSQLKDWKQIRSTSQSLTSLEGFERFTSLALLLLGDRQIRDLTPLQGLTGLDILHLGGTQVKDLRPLQELTALTMLTLWNTFVQDIVPLKKLTALHALYLGGTPVQDLTPLEGLYALATLSLWGTQVQDITPLKELKGLRQLELIGTKVQDLTPIKGLTSLRMLECSSTKVQDLTPLKRLTALTKLEMRSTPVHDLIPIKGLKALATLDITNTSVHDLTPLAGLTALTTLIAENTPVNDLTPIKKLKQLTILNCSSTQIRDLTPLKGLKALTVLDCSSSHVQDLIPIKGLKLLTTLDCSSTQLQDLTPLQGLSELATLFLRNTQVKDLLPLKGLKKLTSLDLRGTPVQDLTPLEQLNSLDSLNLLGTQVPSKQVQEFRQRLPDCLISY